MSRKSNRFIPVYNYEGIRLDMKQQFISLAKKYLSLPCNPVIANYFKDDILSILERNLHIHTGELRFLFEITGHGFDGYEINVTSEHAVSRQKLESIGIIV